MKKSVIRAGNRVALYARFSSDNQRSESIDAQVRAMTAYCRQHHYIVVSTYIDEAKSATTDRRPDFQRMIEDSKKGIFDIVLVHKLDRFARNRYDSAVYKRELKKNGVSVYSVLENLDDSPESIMMESVLETPLDMKNFHKKMAQMPYVVPLDEKEVGVSHRAARYFKFRKPKKNF